MRGRAYSVSRTVSERGGGFVVGAGSVDSPEGRSARAELGCGVLQEDVECTVGTCNEVCAWNDGG